MSSLACLSEQLLLCHSLSSDACMISAWEEEGFIALHTSVSHQRVFNRYSQCMPNVQIACDVGRRQTDNKFLWIGGLVVCMEKFAA